MDNRVLAFLNKNVTKESICGVINKLYDKESYIQDKPGGYCIVFNYAKDEIRALLIMNYNDNLHNLPEQVKQLDDMKYNKLYYMQLLNIGSCIGIFKNIIHELGGGCIIWNVLDMKGTRYIEVE